VCSSNAAKLQEHLRENSRRLLLDWLVFGTFAGDFPAFVAEFA